MDSSQVDAVQASAMLQVKIEPTHTGTASALALPGANAGSVRRSCSPLKMELANLEESRGCISPDLLEAHVKAVRHHAASLAAKSRKSVVDRQLPDIEDDPAPATPGLPDIEDDPKPATPGLPDIEDDPPTAPEPATPALDSFTRSRGQDGNSYCSSYPWPLQHDDVDSAEGCAQLCLADSECVHFMWHKSQTVKNRCRMSHDCLEYTKSKDKIDGYMLNKFTTTTTKPVPTTTEEATTTTEKPDSGGLPDIEEDPAPPATTEEATTTTEKPDSGGLPDIEEDPAAPTTTEEATTTTEKPEEEKEEQEDTPADEAPKEEQEDTTTTTAKSPTGDDAPEQEEEEKEEQEDTPVGSNDGVKDDAPVASIDGSAASLDAIGFKEVTSLCCPPEMEVFFTRLLTSSGYSVCSTPHIQGLMHWFSCVPDMDFAYMLQVIEQGNPCKYWTKVGEACPELSAKCAGNYCR